MKTEGLEYDFMGEKMILSQQELDAVEATGYCCFREYANGITEDRLQLSKVLRNSGGAQIAVKDTIEAIEVVTCLVTLKRPVWGPSDQRRMCELAMQGLSPGRIAHRMKRPDGVVREHFKAAFQ